VTDLGTRTSCFTDAHLDEWRTKGYVVVEGFLTSEEVERALEDLHTVVPTWEQYRDDRASWPDTKPLTFLSFPYKAEAVNDLTVHPDLIDFAERALGTDDIVLGHSEVLAKYADEMDFDQGMHADYMNNSLAVPADDDVDQLASITYYNDVTVDLGPTRVVSFEDSEPWRDRPGWLRADAPELFEREHSVVVPAGSIVVYTMKTYHRGSAFTATEGARFSHHIAYQRADMTWGGWRSYPQLGQTPSMQALMTRLDPRQRSVIGFPRVGHRYWTPWTIDAVQRRYPDMDMTPYREGLAGAGSD
jgi:ectoine hydroxylase-related dioxygenase (phytanoyl-CoA dioxygenase family)